MSTEHNTSAAKQPTPKKAGWGGKRTNSGRKPRGRKGFMIRLSDAERAMLDELRGDVGISDFIRAKIGLTPNFFAPKKKKKDEKKY